MTAAAALLSIPGSWACKLPVMGSSLSLQAKRPGFGSLKCETVPPVSPELERAPSSRSGQRPWPLGGRSHRKGNRSQCWRPRSKLGPERWTERWDRHGFELGLVPVCVRGAKTGHPEGPWALRSLAAPSRAEQGLRGEVQGVGTDWPLLNWEALVYCFVLGVVSFEKQEIEPLYDIDFTA